MNMKGYKHVAIVNLLGDYNQKDYGFALFDAEFDRLENGSFVVVNPRNVGNCVLGIIKNIVPRNEYSSDVTAQVIGVVNMDAYNARVEEEKRQEEIKKKKAAIEKELQEEINKRKNVEFYEEMASKYSDNPRLMELVNELKALEVQ